MTIRPDINMPERADPIECGTTEAYYFRRTEPPKPRTERVNWWEALRDERKIRPHNGEWMAATDKRKVDGRVWIGQAGIGWVGPSDDGTVEVLVERESEDA